MAGELVEARSVLTIGQRLEIFFENTEEGTPGYTSRIEDIVGDELIIAMPVDERLIPVIPRPGENLYVLAGGDGCHYRFFSVHRSHGRYDGGPSDAAHLYAGVCRTVSKARSVPHQS